LFRITGEEKKTLNRLVFVASTTAAVSPTHFVVGANVHNRRLASVTTGEACMLGLKLTP